MRKCWGKFLHCRQCIRSVPRTSIEGGVFEICIGGEKDVWLFDDCLDVGLDLLVEGAEIEKVYIFGPRSTDAGSIRLRDRIGIENHCAELGEGGYVVEGIINVLLEMVEVHLFLLVAYFLEKLYYRVSQCWNM